MKAVSSSPSLLPSCKYFIWVSNRHLSRFSHSLRYVTPHAQTLCLRYTFNGVCNHKGDGQVRSEGDELVLILTPHFIACMLGVVLVTYLSQMSSLGSQRHSH